MKQPYRVKVSSRYGAPMGRPNVGTVDPDSRSKRVHLRRVPLHEGYDPGGAYWGDRPRGVMLFCAWHRDGWVRYLDAKAGIFAEEAVKAYFPDAEFGG